MKDIDEHGRTVAADDDGVGFETPRSGVATPQPDLHDKRLPGIMSYFNQVRPASFKRLLSGTFTSSEQSAAAPSAADATPAHEEAHRTNSPSQLPSIGPVESASPGDSLADVPPLLPHERTGPPPEKMPYNFNLHPYPTPPTSHNSSLRDVRTSNSGRGSGDSGRGRGLGGTLLQENQRGHHKKSHSDLSSLQNRRLSLCVPLMTQSNVHARHFSSPSGRNAVTNPNSPIHSPFTFSDAGCASSKVAPVEKLKKLTFVVGPKSGQSTPRSLSTAQPPSHEVHADASKENGSNIDRTSASTPAPAGAQVPRAKLTVKILEARGIRKSRDPYVVAVFQRSELISGGPHPVETVDETAVTSTPMGGLPLQRQTSDTGRPSMAIPMRSRQSSNTSITDYHTFRNRASRQSITNPKWDAEAVL